MEAIHEEEKPQRPLPEPQNHVNLNIMSFLNHFKAARLIHVDCEDPKKYGHKRSTEEKENIAD